MKDDFTESAKAQVKKCSRSHVSNTETAKALQDVEHGKELIEFESIEDFFKTLEN